MRSRADRSKQASFRCGRRAPAHPFIALQRGRALATIAAQIVDQVWVFSPRRRKVTFLSLRISVRVPVKEQRGGGMKRLPPCSPSAIRDLPRVQVFRRAVLTQGEAAAQRREKVGSGPRRGRGDSGRLHCRGRFGRSSDFRRWRLAKSENMKCKKKGKKKRG